ncbi:MAG: LPXTG cell wall anchor domain-containing protein, partial [Erysipelotrichaceae bacterium]|nr:LPXTG cell wall anchor domain-containing protein [Erysipelotrichaceae bacterium]
RCDGEFGKFTGFAVDGNTLSASDYTAVSGSTIVTIKATYLNTLPLGKHTVQFYYSDGSAKGEFSIIAPAYEVPTEGYVTPKTGDETNMLMWLGLMFISGLGVITFVRKKA